MFHSLSSYLRFFWAGLAQHSQTGGIVPSQRFLVARMIAPIPSDYRGQVVELGAGTGALTLRLAAKCPKARILACEINPLLAREHSRNIARAGLAERVELFTGPADDLLSKDGQRKEFIVSGIPLGNLDKARTLDIIDAISRSLAPAGMYIQFQHSLLDRKKIRTRFPDLRTVPVFLNFPPAVVYYARKL